MADFDDDGDLDLVITNQHGPPSIYRSDAVQKTGRAWLGLTLQGNGRTTHRSAIGTQVLFRWQTAAGPQQELREVGTLTGFGGQSDPRLHVGLGDITSDAVEAEIRWYGGAVETRRLAPRAYHVATQP
jgi:hypothetical protein